MNLERRKFTFAHALRAAAVVVALAAPAFDSLVQAATVSLTGSNISGSCQYTAASLDSASNYTFTVTGCTGFSSTTPTTTTVSGFSNISTRARVDTGTGVMIAGFAITGASPRQVLVVARGPSLAQFNIANALADPTLRIVASATNTELATNDNFGTASNLAEIQATGLAPTDSKESAILITLTPGLYTAIVEGANAGTGVAIVEVFDRQLPSGALSLDTTATAASISAGTGSTTIAVARTGGSQGALTGTLSVTGGCVFAVTNAATAPVSFTAGSTTTQNFTLGAGTAASGTSCGVSLDSAVLGQPSSVTVSVVQSAPPSSCTTTATRNYTWGGGQIRVDPLFRGDTVAVKLMVADYPLQSSNVYSFAVSENPIDSARGDVQATISTCPGDFAASTKFQGTCMIHVPYTGGAIKFGTTGEDQGRVDECVLPAGTTTVYFNLRQIQLPTPTPVDGPGTPSCAAGQNCWVPVNLSR